MSETVTVSVPNKHTKAEARSRIEGGFDKATEQLRGKATIEKAWTDDTLVVNAKAMGQSVDGTLTVFEDHVHIEVRLPWLLKKLAAPLSQKLEKNAQLLLK